MIQYQCPQCGKPFATEMPAQRVRCPYCGHEFTTAYGSVPPQYGGPQPPYGYGQPQYIYGQPQYAYGPMPGAEPGVFDNGPSGKSRGVAGLLAILIGGLGAHYFYLGKTGGGLLCILLSLVTCGLWPWIMLVQGIVMMTMRQSDFEQKYIYSQSTMPLF